MIVQCQECSTKFRLDDSKVGEAGVKVRCAKCRHIFVVHREQPTEEPDVDTMLQGLGGEGRSVEEPPVTSPAGPSVEMDDELLRSLAGTSGDEPTEGPAEFSFDIPAEESAPAAAAGGGTEFELDISMPGDLASEATAPLHFEPPSFQEFSFDTPEGAGEEQPSTPSREAAADRGASFAADEEVFSFGESPLATGADIFAPAGNEAEKAASTLPDGTSEPPPFAFEPFAEAPGSSARQEEEPEKPSAGPEPTGGDFVFGELPTQAAADDRFTFAPPAEPEAVSRTQDTETFSFDVPPVMPAAEPPAVAAADMRTLFATGGAEAPIAEPLVFGGGESESEEGYPPLSIASRKRGGGLARLLLVLVPVLLAVAAGAGWWYVQQNGVAPLEGVLSAVGVDMAPRFELSGVKGSYVAREDGIELFVVQGEVKNLSRFARAEVQVRATIFGAGNRPLARKTAFCGNPLPVAKLAALPLADIEKAMANRFGEGLSNLEVRGEGTVPFAVVFVAPPADAVDYGVELAGSMLAQKKKE